MNLSELETRIKQEPVTGNMFYGLQDEEQRQTQLHTVAVIRELFGAEDIPDSADELRRQLRELYDQDPIPGHSPMLYCDHISDLAWRYVNPDNQVSIPLPAD